MILVVGGYRDPEVQWLVHRLATMSEVLVLWIGGPKIPLIEYDYEADTLKIDNEIVKPEAVWYRYDVFTVPAYVASPWHRIIQSWVRMHPEIRSINKSWSNRINDKIYQLMLAKRIGFQIPETIISNSSEKKKNCVTKPIDNGECVPYDPKDIGPSPVPQFIQEQLSYPEYRIYLVVDTLFTFRIESKSLDHRSDPEGTVIEEIEINEIPNSPKLDSLCRKLFSDLELDYGALDLKTDTAGNPILLEVNDFPMNSHLDRLSRGRMSERLGKFLLGEKPNEPAVPELSTDS